MYALSIQLCPKKGINPTILLWGWDWDHQTYSREGYGCLGMVILMFVFSEKKNVNEVSVGVIFPDRLHIPDLYVERELIKFESSTLAP